MDKSKAQLQQPHIFKHDHIVRTYDMKPIARVILTDDNSYVRGEPIKVAFMSTLMTPQVLMTTTFYIDGLPYRIPKGISQLKMRTLGVRTMLNNFDLIPDSSKG